jgi:tetraacyldisaccharide 4'-kinase
VLSDDGLQHTALPRSFEVCVFDARRGLGNGYCLPAGPLRQPADRLATVDLVLVKCGAGETGENIPGTAFVLETGELEAVGDNCGDNCGDNRRRPPRPPAEIDALAGIADPEAFFRVLDRRGFRLRRRALADHQPVTAEMLAGLAGPVVMTVKDSMRLPPHERDDLFVLPVRARLPREVVQQVVGHVREFLA